MFFFKRSFDLTSSSKYKSQIYNIFNMFLITFSALRLKYLYDAAGCLIWINDDISSYCEERA